MIFGVRLVVQHFESFVTNFIALSEYIRRDSDSIVATVINYFSDVFHWQYQNDPQNQKKESIAVVLAFAVDDVTSFIGNFHF